MERNDPLPIIAIIIDTADTVIISLFIYVNSDRPQ
jgi:hypothetical protein